MFQIEAKRLGCEFVQSFKCGKKAKSKALWLIKNGFTVKLNGVSYA